MELQIEATDDEKALIVLLIYMTSSMIVMASYIGATMFL